MGGAVRAVEADEAIAALVAGGLAEAGHEVGRAPGGARAPALLERRPRLVRTGLRHPGADGGTIPRRRGELGAPVIVTSARPRPRAPDGVVLVPEPFDLEALLGAVAATAPAR
jgi:DNA-binding response OmpR family regulator